MNQPAVMASCASDAEIITKIMAGEKDYFEILIRRYNSVLYKIGRSYGFTHDDVQDLMQETHLAAYQNMPKFEARSTYKTWLIRIMLNKCYHWTQKVNHIKNTFSEATTTGNVQPHAGPNADVRQEILNRELGLVLEKCIEKLPLEYRTIFVLRELEGLNIQETAQAANISETNVKVRLNRAKTMLRKQLENWYPQAAVYEFNLVYCDKIVENVISKI